MIVIINTEKKNLTGAEYHNYGKQYQVFQQILAVYETEPDNFPRLVYKYL